MTKITNIAGIDLPIAVWLMQDGYNSGADEAPEGELISATSLMKPVRQQILQRKVDVADKSVDVADLIASRMGHALHDSIERTWKDEAAMKHSLRLLGYPEKVVNAFRVNPDPDTIKEDDIVVWIEKRGFKQFDGVVITGQSDFTINGAYRDFKSTSTFSYTSGNKDEDYIIQGSIYRWLMPEMITSDVMRIEFLFTDWLKYRARVDPRYPQQKSVHKEFPLMSLKETEEWILDRLATIRQNAGKPQDKMIECTDKELWKGDDEYKYYTDPKKAAEGGRCTRRFKKEADANAHLQDKGKGVIVVDPGEVKACTYCSAFPICEQRKQYFDDDGQAL